jgi:hypothetical protein
MPESVSDCPKAWFNGQKESTKAKTTLKSTKPKQDDFCILFIIKIIKLCYNLSFIFAKIIKTPLFPNVE